MDRESVTTHVKMLLSQHSEGEWWDFKLQHHADKGRLVHDILCLANTVTRCDKYIIFGIDDETLEVKGVPEKDKKSQSDILDIIQKLSFAGDRVPKLALFYIPHGGTEIGVIAIADEPFKPFTLTRDYTKGTRVPKGVVFTRNQCRNTPIDSCAKDHEVEGMWKERLGVPIESSLLWRGSVSSSEIGALTIHGFSEITFTFFNQVTGITSNIIIGTEQLRNYDELRFLVEGDVLTIRLVREVYENDYSKIWFGYSSRDLRLNSIHGRY